MLNEKILTQTETIKPKTEVEGSVEDYDQNKFESLVDEVVPSFDEALDYWSNRSSRYHTEVRAKGTGDDFEKVLASEIYALEKDEAELNWRQINKGFEGNDFAAYFSPRGFVANRVKNERGYIWQSLYRGQRTPAEIAMGVESSDAYEIPVAAILEKPSEDGEKAQLRFNYGKNEAGIISRFSGINGDTTDVFVCKQTEQNLPSKELRTAEQNELVARLNELHDLVMRKVDELEEKLHTLGIEHGDFKSKNCTVEYVDKEYLARMRSEGYSINNMPFDQDSIKFDARQYIKDPDRYEVVVRAIDFDNITLFPQFVV